MHVLRMRPAAALALAAVLALTGCGATSEVETAVDETVTAPTGAGLTVEDSWVKAAPDGMTALFGRIRNTGSGDITIVSGSTDIADKIELHEVVLVGGETKMQPKAGGFVVPAGGTYELAPGADHVMLMGLKQAVAAGDQVTVTLSTETGDTLVVEAVAKEFSGANESYQPTPMESMSASATP